MKFSVPSNYRLENFIKGWFIGDFEKSLVRTKDFEVAIKKNKNGDKEGAHFNKIAEKFVVITKGSCKLNNKIFKEGDIVYIKPGEAVDFEALEECHQIVVKIPSLVGDKYEV